jgi:hypothetical protein
MTDHRNERPEIDYLAKDFNSFRQLMLDHISLRVPEWTEEHPADMAQAVVDVLAYVADYLSYYQDAVATEAYLGTARLRVSVRRHARLLDYPLDDGCNARVWVQIQAPKPEGYEAVSTPSPEGGKDNQIGRVYVPRGTQLMTRTAEGADTREEGTLCFEVGDPAALDRLKRGAQVFETMYEAWVYPEFNEIRFFAQKGGPWTLEPNVYTALLEDWWPGDEANPGPRKLWRLQAGDVLLFEQIRDPETLRKSGDPERRHAVRLTEVKPTVAPNREGKQMPVVRVTWATPDALREPLPLVRSNAAGDQIPVSVARGNIVLADHGRTVKDEILPAVPLTGRYNPPLLLTGLTFHAPYDDRVARRLPAVRALEQDRRTIVPAIRLVEFGTEVAAPQALPVRAGEADPQTNVRPLLPAADQYPTEGTSAPYIVRHVGRDGQPAGLFFDQTGKPLPLETLLDAERLPSPEPPRLPPAPVGFEAGELEFAPIATSTGAGSVLASASGGRVIVKSWQARGELMGASQRTREFVVEVEDGGRATLRFGYGSAGWQPTSVGAPFRATYRVGMGAEGNVGPNAIRHLITDDADLRAAFGTGGEGAPQIRNFLPAEGGRDAASLDAARLEAPAAMQVQERCVTVDDYRVRAEQYADVARAVARMRPVGSWQAVFIYVRRESGRPVDRAFRDELTRYFEHYRMIGHYVEALGPVLVPLDVELDAYLAEGRHATQVAGPLEAALGIQSAAAGPRAFFDPAGFEFSQTFHPSAFVRRAMSVPGIARVEVRAFRRHGAGPAVGVIQLRDVELGHVDQFKIDWQGLPGAQDRLVLQAEPVSSLAGREARAHLAPADGAPAEVAPAAAGREKSLVFRSGRGLSSTVESDLDDTPGAAGHRILARGAVTINLWGQL